MVSAETIMTQTIGNVSLISTRDLRDSGLLKILQPRNGRVRGI